MSVKWDKKVNKRRIWIDEQYSG